MKKILNYLIVLIVISIWVISFWVYEKYVKVESQKYITFDSKIWQIKETIKARGEVVNEKNYNLDLLYTWIVEDIFVEKWDIVQKWDLLLKLDTTDFELELKSWNTLKNQSIANLEKLESWSRPEDIKLHATAVNNAKNNFDNIVRFSEEEVQSAIADVEVAKISLDNAAISVKNAEIWIINSKISLNKIEAVNEVLLSNLYENLKITLQQNLISISYTLTRINNVLDSNKQFNSKFTSVLWIYDEQSLLIAKNDYIILKEKYKESKDNLDLLDENSSIEQIDDIALKIGESLDLALKSLVDLYIVLEKSSTNSDFSYDDLKSLMTLVGSYQLEINQERQFFSNKLQDIKLLAAKADEQRASANANIDIAKIRKDEALAMHSSAQTKSKSVKQKLIVIEAGLKTKAQAAKWEFEFAEDKLSLVNAWARKEDVQIAKSQIEEIDTKIDILKEKINKSSLYSPFQAKVVDILVEKWELFRSSIDRSKSVIALVSLDYIVQSDISEIDISKIRETNFENNVEVIFDAFDQKSFNWKIISIEPREIVKDWDSYYRVNIVIDEKEQMLRSWMSADLKIIISTKDEVLMVPEITIFKEDDETFTYILDWEILNKIDIVTWIADWEYVEIIQGIFIWDIIAIPSN